MEKIDCPKCGSQSAWIETTYVDKILRCMCGYHKVVETKLETITITHTDHGDDVKLPKKGTHLWVTLATLAVYVQATSSSLTDTLNLAGHTYSVSDVASYLALLRVRGLVYTTINRRGVPGGSTWALTEKCSVLLGV